MDPYLNQAAARAHIDDLERTARAHHAFARQHGRPMRDLLRGHLRQRSRFHAVASEARS